MGIQVQLRGGTSTEHSGFTGAPREVTVDTSNKTLRVHDGLTPGGNPLATVEELTNVNNTLNDRIDELENAPIDSHTHPLYVSRGTENMSVKQGMLATMKNGYYGMCREDGTDTGFMRTPQSGLLPYQSGSSSFLGTEVWRFSYGFFDGLNANSITVNNKISFNSNDRVTYDDSTKKFSFVADDDVNNSIVACKCVELSGKRIYIGSTAPSDMREGDILIQV